MFEELSQEQLAVLINALAYWLENATKDNKTEVRKVRALLKHARAEIRKFD